MGADQLLQYLSQGKNNLMAAIPPPGTQSGPMPKVLLKLKESINGVPFALNTPSMQQATQAFQMIQGLLQMIKQQGGNPASVGANTHKLFAQSNSSVTNADAAQIAMGSSVADIVAATGQALSFGAGLSTFMPADDLEHLNGIANGTVKVG